MFRFRSVLVLFGLALLNLPQLSASGVEDRVRDQRLGDDLGASSASVLLYLAIPALHGGDGSALYN